MAQAIRESSEVRGAHEQCLFEIAVHGSICHETLNKWRLAVERAARSTD